MSSSKNLEYEKTAFLNKSNNAFIEEMYMRFVNNDPTLPDSWKRYFNEIGEEFDVIVAKGVNSPLGAYQEVCSHFIRVDTQGVTSANLDYFDYQFRRRPMYPFENDFDWCYKT